MEILPLEILVKIVDFVPISELDAILEINKKIHIAVLSSLKNRKSLRLVFLRGINDTYQVDESYDSVHIDPWSPHTLRTEKKLKYLAEIRGLTYLYIKGSYEDTWDFASMLLERNALSLVSAKLVNAGGERQLPSGIIFPKLLTLNCEWLTQDTSDQCPNLETLILSDVQFPQEFKKIKKIKLIKDKYSRFGRWIDDRIIFEFGNIVAKNSKTLVVAEIKSYVNYGILLHDNYDGQDIAYPNLEKLTLSNYIERLDKLCPKLRKLMLHHIPDKVPISIYNLRLDIWWFIDFNTLSIKPELVQFVNQLPHLIKLSLDVGIYKDQAIEFVCDIHSLKYLSLKGYNPDPVARTLINSNKDLKEVILWGNDWSEDTIKPLFQRKHGVKLNINIWSTVSDRTSEKLDRIQSTVESLFHGSWLPPPIISRPMPISYPYHGRPTLVYRIDIIANSGVVI